MFPETYQKLQKLLLLFQQSSYQLTQIMNLLAYPIFQKPICMYYVKQTGIIDQVSPWELSYESMLL